MVNKKLLSALNQIPICRLCRKMASFVHHGMRQIRRSCGAFAFLIWVGVCLGAVVHEVQAQAGLTSAVAAASAPALASGSLDSSSTGSDPEAPPPAIGYYKAHGSLLWLAFSVFFPAGVLVSKYTQASFPHWFHLHRILEVNICICYLASYFSLRVLVISCSSRAGHVQLCIT